MVSFHLGFYRRILSAFLIFLTLFSFTLQSIAGPVFSHHRHSDDLSFDTLSTKLLRHDSSVDHNPIAETRLEEGLLSSQPFLMIEREGGSSMTEEDLSGTPETFIEEDLRFALTRLQKTEETYHHATRLSYLSSLVNRGLYLSFLRESQELSSEDISSSSRLWIYGESTLLKTERARQKVYGLDAFLEGNVTVLMEGADLAFKILLVTQIFYSITEHQSFGNIFELVFNGDDNSIRGIYHVGKEIPNAQYFWFIFTLPTCWGLFKGYQAFHQGSLQSIHHLEESLKALRSASSSIYRDFLRWFLPFNEVEEHLASLTLDLLWNGSFSEEDRIKSFQTLVGFLNVHGGRSRNAALDNFSRIVNGNSVRNGKAIDPEIREGILNRKAQALILLEKEGTDLKHKIFGKQIFWKGLPALYSRYLLWSLGQCQDPKEYLFWTTAYLGKSVLIILLLKTIIKGILDIMDCPQQPGFTWTGGPPPWASDYTYGCFNVSLKTFCNPLPAQPVEMLTSLFPKFYLPSTITMNLSGKALNGTVIAQILNAFREAQPEVMIEALDVSNNNIGLISSEDTEIFAEALQELISLKSLNLFNNDIENTDSLGTPMLAKALSLLTQLQDLNLSHNWLGSNDSKGTIAFAYGLSYLANLQTLNISLNYIERTDSLGLVVFAKALSTLAQLQVLDLSKNSIGLIGSNGTIALAEALSYLTQIQNLNLSQNHIGYTDSQGTIALAEALSYLTELQHLYLSSNYIGATDSQGTIALAEALPYLTQLQTLNLISNTIGYSGLEGIEDLGNSLSQMGTLESVFLQQNPFYNTTFCQFYLPWISCPLYFEDPSSLENYLSNLPNLTTSLNLGRTLNVYVNVTIMMETLSKYLPRFPYLKTLDVSNNAIGQFSSSNIIVLAEGLSYLTQLEVLRLGSNWIGYTDSKGTIELAKSLTNLTNIQTLDLSINSIGFQNFGIGLQNSKGIIALAEALPYLAKLQSLDLSTNGIGILNSKGTIALAEALPYLENLQSLDLSGNAIGLQNSSGVVALAIGLKNMKQLETLDLSNNWIGITGPQGPEALLSILGALTQHSLSNLSLDGITNITWTEEANAFKILIDKSLEAKCASELCQGESLSASGSFSGSSSQRRSLVKDKISSLYEASASETSQSVEAEDVFFDAESFEEEVSGGEGFQGDDTPETFFDVDSFVRSSAPHPMPPAILTFLPKLWRQVPLYFRDLQFLFFENVGAAEILGASLHLLPSLESSFFQGKTFPEGLPYEGSFSGNFSHNVSAFTYSFSAHSVFKNSVGW